MKGPGKQNKISSYLNFYLKRRRLMGDVTSDGRKKFRKFVCSKDELLLSSLVANNSNLSNSVSLSCLSSDPNLLEDQFNKFESFLTNNLEDATAELDCLLFPFLLHTFADLIGNGFRTAATNLLHRKCSLFPEKELFKSLSTNTIDEKVLTDFLTEIKTKKFKASLSNVAFQHLLIFLKGQSNLYIHQLLNRHVDLTILHDDECPDSSPLQSENEKFDTINQPSGNNEDLLQTFIKISSKLKSSSHFLLPSIHQFDFTNDSQSLCCSNISPDEKLLACGFEDSNILICKLEPQSLHSNNCNETILRCERNSFQMKGHSHTVSSVDFFPDSRWLISGSSDKTVRLWDVHQMTSVVSYRGHTYQVTGVSVCVGPMFASCSFDQTVKLWSTDRIFPLRNFIGHTQSVDCVACHPNGNYLATGSSDMTVRLWNVQDGRSVRLMVGHQGRVDVLCFSPDGKLLASAGEDTCVKVWDLGTGLLLKNLQGHTDHIYSLAFNKHSNVLASGGLDGKINTWNLSGKERLSNVDGLSSSSPELLNSLPTNSDCIVDLKYADTNVLYVVTKHF